MPFLPVSAYIFGLFFSAEAKKRVDGGEQRYAFRQKLEREYAEKK
jgi:hypothetical protein